MANKKYNNLTALMSAGRFNWAADVINAMLVVGAVFDATDVTVNDLGAPVVGVVPVPGRQIAPDGSMLGWPVSFEGITKDIIYQMVLYRDDGSEKKLITWYDTDEKGALLSIKNNGALIVRPTPVAEPLPPILGTWIGF